MLTFTSEYPCPIRMKRSGGGPTGLCLMEAFSVLESPKLPSEYTDSPKSVPTVIRNIGIEINDLGNVEISDNERADLLWPVLPKMFNLDKAVSHLPKSSSFFQPWFAGNYPWTKLLEELGVTVPCGTVSNLMAFYAQKVDEEGIPRWDYNKAVKVLETALSVLWETAIENGCPIGPQDDFAPYQIQNLESWIDSLQEVYEKCELEGCEHRTGSSQVRRMEMVPA